MGAFVPLKHVSEYEKEVVGQKAILLGQKSVSIPFSLVITSDVFIEFIRHNNLMEDINVLFSNQELSSINLLRGFNQITPKILAGKFPPQIAQSLRECYELACLDTQSLDVLQGKKKQPILMAIRRSTTYNDQDIMSKGVVYSKDDYDAFLHALKVVYLSAFTPTSVVLRQKNHVDEFSIAIVVTRLPQISTCFESSYLVDQKKLFVSSYVGFIDKSRMVQRDTFDVAVDFLKINKQHIQRQKNVSMFDLHTNAPVIKDFEFGSAQSATEQQVLEIARLTKKITNEFAASNLITDIVMDNEKKLYCLDIWTSQDIDDIPKEGEERKERAPIDASSQPTNNLHQAVITFLKQHKDSKYSVAIGIILQSLQTDSSSQTIVQGLQMCQQILEQR